MTEAQVTAAVRREDHGAVRLLTIDRPRALNALDLTAHTALIDALVAADADPSVGAVVLTGAGERAFCAGADLKARSRGEALVPPEHPRGVAALVVSVPVLVAVNGLAHGLGAEIVLAADLAVMAADADLCLPEVRRGLLAAGGGAVRLPSLVPRKIALRWLLTGERVPAAEAVRWGLVNEIVPAADVLPRALALAAEVAAAAPLAVRATKRLATGAEADGTRGADEAAAWARLDVEVAALAASDDAQEGARAFAEGRAPRWNGRPAGT